MLGRDARRQFSPRRSVMSRAEALRSINACVSPSRVPWITDCIQIQTPSFRRNRYVTVSRASAINTLTWVAADDSASSGWMKS